MAGRPKLEPGDWTPVQSKKSVATGKWRAFCRFGGYDGRTATVERYARTKAIAERAVLDAVMKRREKGQPLGEDAPLKEVAEAWLASIEPPRVDVNERGEQVAPKTETRIRRQTWEQYSFHVRLHITPAMGDMRVSNIRTSTCERFLHGLIKEGGGHTTARLARTALQQLLGYAVRHDLLASNPVRDVSALPKKVRTPEALSEETLYAVREAVTNWRTAPGTFGPPNDGTLADVVSVLLGSGVRLGEALALRFQDIDLTGDVGKVHITGTLVEGNGPKYRQTMPKTSSSNRTIPVPRFVVDTLLRRSVAMPPGNITDAVFYTRTGSYLQASSLRRSLRSALAAAGMNPKEVKVTPHAFRRTVATMLAREMNDGAAAALLGHSSVSITHAHYIQRLSEVEDYRVVLDKLGAPKA